MQGSSAEDAAKAFTSILSAAPSKLHPMHVVQIDCFMPLVNISRAKRDLQVCFLPNPTIWHPWLNLKISYSGDDGLQV